MHPSSQATTPPTTRQGFAPVHCAGVYEPPFSAMSIATDSTPSSVQCKNPLCGRYGKRWEFIENQFCTHACSIEADGMKALSKLKYDHRICYTCGAKLKSVYRPEGDVRGLGHETDVYNQPPDNFIGVQSDRPDATWGEKAHPKDDRYVRTGSICDYCGNTDHKERIDEIWYDYPDHYAERLLTLLEDDTDEAVDREIFWEQYDRENFEYAVGKAVYSDT